jgi:hypothetical protein
MVKRAPVNVRYLWLFGEHILTRSFTARVQVFGRRQERGARHAQLTGVQKAPRHEVAGSWAPAGQRRYGDLMSATTLMVGATLPGSDRDMWTGEVGRLQWPSRQALGGHQWGSAH